MTAIHATALDAAPPQGTCWVSVCTVRELPHERGVAALVHGTQIALFRTFDEKVFAVQQSDPCSGAMVISRALMGSRDGRPTLTSPMLGQIFDLATGACLDGAGKPAIGLRTWPVRVIDHVVSVGMTEHLEASA